MLTGQKVNIIRHSRKQVEKGIFFQGEGGRGEKNHRVKEYTQNVMLAYEFTNLPLAYLRMV